MRHDVVTRLVFWETTKACNLSCKHCRAVPQRALGPTELRTAARFDLIDQIAQGREAGVGAVGRRAAVPSRPLRHRRLRRRVGFRMALATNGTLVDERGRRADRRRRLLARRDQSRRRDPGDPRPRSAACRDRTPRRCAACASCARKACRSRSTRRSRSTTSTELPRCSISRWRSAPTRCTCSCWCRSAAASRSRRREMLPADEYERVLHWFDEQSKTCPIDLKATCAPHYYRIRAQRLERSGATATIERPSSRRARAPRRRRRCCTAAAHGQHLSAMTRGCLAGTAVCFISNEGNVYPCGYLPVSAGRHAGAAVQRHLERLAGVPAAAESGCATKASAASAATRRSAAAAAPAPTPRPEAFLPEEPFCLFQPEDAAGRIRGTACRRGTPARHPAAAGVRGGGVR